jgi:hypothetical protein
MVVRQINLPISKRNRELDRRLSCILRKTNKQKTLNIYIHTQTHTHSMYLCLYDGLRSRSESASHSSPPQLKSVPVILACVRVCVLTAVVHAHKSAQTKTDTVMHISAAYIRLRFHRKKRKEISTHACTCTCACMCPPQLNHLNGVRVCTTCASVCAATIPLIHPLYLSVCLVRPCVLMLVYTMLRYYACATRI